MNKVINFAKKEFVLIVAWLLAIISMAFVPINSGYIEYIDFSVLSILFCLMAVVAGFIKLGLFDFLSQKLLEKSTSTKVITASLVYLCFFCAMIVTNDVALITFVPLTISIFGKISPKRLIYIIVLETMAANLGSMLTPIGNPQNLFIYSYYNMNIIDFLSTVAPVCIFSLIVITALLLLGKSSKIQHIPCGNISVNKKNLIFYTLLFLLSILTVLRVLDYRACLILTAVLLLIFDKKLFAKVDYSLLLTFVAFFIFVGNMSNIPQIKAVLSQLVLGKELFVGVVTSQIISNVPATIMLSGFTQNAKALLLGVNIGGLGTLIASLASLISYKFYARTQNANHMLFIAIFTAINLATLAVILGFTVIFYGGF